ncbi:tRNA-dihydrouridine synthase, partial [Salmonella enterica subsp. enterica serovar Anatum]|nr:tRNA-dihydrouridine synthase [Salmonella enterica subsp. enterica serovar Anatum]
EPGIRTVQIAGSDPVEMADAARINVESGAQIIDINMGCPAKKGESKVVVAAPVIAELNMPRFLAGGDVSRLVLDVTNLTDRPQT